MSKKKAKEDPEFGNREQEWTASQKRGRRDVVDRNETKDSREHPEASVGQKRRYEVNQPPAPSSPRHT